jgi:hypothetical protein
LRKYGEGVHGGNIKSENNFNEVECTGLEPVTLTLRLLFTIPLDSSFLAGAY